MASSVWIDWNSTSAPNSAQYWVGAADATLTAEKNLGGLATALVLNTAGVPSAYAGTGTVASQFLTAISAVGDGTFAAPSVAASAVTAGTFGIRVQSSVQPGFLAYMSTNNLALASGATIPMDTEVYDEAGNFAASTFTAPVAGRYLFTVAVTVAATAFPRINLVTTSRSYRMAAFVGAYTGALGGSVIADLGVGDTARLTQADTVAVDTFGSGSPYVSFFSGRLLP